MREILLCALLVPILSCAAPGPPPSSPASLDDVLRAIRDRHGLPALAGAVVIDERILAGAVGVRKLGDPTPVTLNDQFHLGSDTKAMTAVLIAMAIQEGRLRWGTTLEHALPNLAGDMQAAYRSVTIDQLLAHEAGFSADSALAGKNLMQIHMLPGSPKQQREEYAAALLSEPPVAAPGTQSLYSNRSYAVAGVILERIYGMPWESLIQEKLFKPLGMETAGFYAMGTPGKVDEPWQHRVENGSVVPVGPGPFSDNPAAIGPAGVVHCSIGDWAKFVRMVLQGAEGRDTLIKAAPMKRLLTSPDPGCAYAGGWGITQRAWGGGDVYTHAGSNTMNYCVAWLAPTRGFAVMAATNQGGDDAAKACDEASAALIGWVQAHRK